LWVSYVAIDSPKGEANTGGRTAAPLFAEIARLCLRNEEPLVPTTSPLAEEATPNPVTREIAQALQSEDQISGAPLSSDINVDIHSTSMPNFVGHHLRSVVEQTEKIGLVVKLKGQGHFVRHQYPAPGAQLEKAKQLVLFLK
jgi:hypothetical protein